jgi:hypothetical protein
MSEEEEGEEEEEVKNEYLFIQSVILLEFLHE